MEMRSLNKKNKKELDGIEVSLVYKMPWEVARKSSLSDGKEIVVVRMSCTSRETGNIQKKNDQNEWNREIRIS